MKKFIYNGFYYPAIGSSLFWENKNTKNIIIGSLFGIYYGFKCKVSHADLPYKQFVIDEIKKHPEMVLTKMFYDYQDGAELSLLEANGKTASGEDVGIFWSVEHKDGCYIGDIKTAYSLTNLRFIQPTSKHSKVCQVGQDAKSNKWVGWSHRAKGCFGLGDKIRKGDIAYCADSLKPHKRGGYTILYDEEGKQAAINFAKAVS